MAAWLTCADGPAGIARVPVYVVTHVDLEQHGQRIKDLEIIGHERPVGADPSEEIKSRFYSNTGNTLDYVYELQGDTLTVWGGERGVSGVFQVSVPDPRSAACRYCHATDRACSTLWLLDPPGRTYVTWVQAHHALGEPTIIYGAPSGYDSSRQPVRMLRSGVA